jgi:hypothetical protein
MEGNLTLDFGLMLLFKVPGPDTCGAKMTIQLVEAHPVLGARRFERHALAGGNAGSSLAQYWAMSGDVVPHGVSSVSSMR